MNRSLIILLLLIPWITTMAQQRCGTVEYNRDLLKRDGLNESDFEQWIASLSAARQSGVQAGEYTIRVVVHIIHNGEPVGTGTNISDAQVISQMRVLNEDFQRKNTDASKTLTIFKSVAAAMPVKFVLASTDPDGNPSTGIVRVKGIKSGYTRDENAQAKALSYWPAENYVNIWVCNLTDYFG
ncbi:MAG: hypothetical protein ACKO3B_11640, partial [Bacteroidota bacterium]